MVAIQMASGAQDMTLAEAADAVRAFEGEIGARYLERGREIRGLSLAVVSGAHILLLGPPGTAKSALTNALSAGLGWPKFERLLAKTTVPEELFGPFDLSGLEERPSRFERVTAGYLPTARVAFLDEIFKANSAILNGLLSILNERVFDQGPRRLRVPLEVCVGASNEYPQDETLAALYDRFLLRFWVSYLKDDASFEALLLADDRAMPTLDERAVAVLRDAAARVDLRPIVPIVSAVRLELATKHGIVASDRRWRQAMGLVRAAAAIDGRTVAVPRDLAVLADCLWDRAEQADAIRGVLTPHYSPDLRVADDILGLAQGIVAGLPPLKAARADALGTLGNGLADLERKLAEIRRLDQTDPDVAQRTAAVAGLLGSVNEAIVRITRRSM